MKQYLRWDKRRAVRLFDLRMRGYTEQYIWPIYPRCRQIWTTVAVWSSNGIPKSHTASNNDWLREGIIHFSHTPYGAILVFLWVLCEGNPRFKGGLSTHRENNVEHSISNINRAIHVYANICLTMLLIEIIIYYMNIVVVRGRYM